MSLQLTLYPQVNEGIYTWEQTVSNTNLVADHSYNFAAFYFAANVFTSSSPTPAKDSIQNSTIPLSSVWQGFKSDGTVYSNVTAPTITSGNLNLPSTGNSVCGAYQLVDGLQPGIDYVWTISYFTAGRGTVEVGFSDPQQMFIGGQSFHQTGLFSQSFSSVQQFFSTQGTFTATSQECIFCVRFIGNGVNNDTTKIMQVSVKQSQSTPTITNVSDGQVVLDLFDHSPIPMTLSVDDFKKIAEKPQSFSKAFNLPATKHNNKIFKNIFDASVVTDIIQNPATFNPYIITKAVLKEDGSTIFEGHMQLLDIKEKQGEIVYSVNLFSTAVSLKTILGNKTLADLDGGATGGGIGLSELDHLWTKTQIKPSWIGQLPLINTVPSGYTGYLTTRLGACTGGETETNVLKYPFVQWNGGITQDQGGTTHGFPRLNHMCNAFRPWIKLKYLVDRIIGEAGYTYQSDFMEGTGNYANPQGLPNIIAKFPDFQRLFMDMNWGSKNTPGDFGTNIEATYVRDNATGDNRANPENTWVNLQLTDNTVPLEALGYNTSTHQFVVPEDNFIYTFDIEVLISNNDNGAVNDRFHVALSRYSSTGSWLGNIDAQYNNNPSSSTVTTINLNGTVQAMQNDVIKLQFNKVAPTSGQGGAPNDVRQGDTSDTSSIGTTMVVSCVPGRMTSNVLLSKRGKIKQFDFLKDIFTMFNLIVLQDKDDPTKLKIDPYDDIFIDNEYTTGINAKVHDWTEKVDITEHELKPIKLKKDVFWEPKKDDKDYARSVYVDATGNELGIMQITTGATVPSGEQKIQLKVFSPTYCKPLFTGFTNKLYVPQILNMKSDGTTQGFDNKPRVLYDMNGDHSNYNNLTELPVGASGIQKTYRIPSFNGVTGENQSKFLQFGHVTAYPTSAQQRDFNFGPVQMINYGGTPRTLYAEYWSPYYNELYDSNTMVVKIKCILTPIDMSNVNFYDKIFIKNREYRINKIDYKAGELSTVELIRIP
ncbi:MAG: hypothetical protein Unbinned176contig1000_3 [Prokaryotic dsDNA virus sp.]|nr:MAG: hypothetical protein Unbinned176contig1000_3 [Prokaryotic dsDNA virus sp.]